MGKWQNCVIHVIKCQWDDDKACSKPSGNGHVLCRGNNKDHSQSNRVVPCPADAYSGSRPLFSSTILIWGEPTINTQKNLVTSDLALPGNNQPLCSATTMFYFLPHCHSHGIQMVRPLDAHYHLKAERDLWEYLHWIDFIVGSYNTDSTECVMYATGRSQYLIEQV